MTKYQASNVELVPVGTLEPVCLENVFYISKLAENCTRIGFNLFHESENFLLDDILIKTHKCKIEAVLVKKWETVNSEITSKLKNDLRTVLTHKQQVGVNFGLQLLSFCESLMAYLE